MKYLILGSGILLSVMAGYLSVLGMQAIFPGAPILIGLIIGSIEFSKYITAVWIHTNWGWLNFKYKFISVSMMIVLTMLTNMSIFGFFSKQHLESGRSSGDVVAKIEIVNSKIDFEKQNIENAKKSVEQLNKVVDEIVSRSDKEKSILTANRIRTKQKQERLELNKVIEESTNNIQKLNEEKFPLEAESRSATIEVGAIKYISELIYGESSPDILEKAVRFVIIAIVFVFDPLAIYLLLIFNMKKPEEVKPEIIEDTSPVKASAPVDILSKFEKDKHKRDAFHPEVHVPFSQKNTDKAPDVITSTHDFSDDIAWVHPPEGSHGLAMFEEDDDGIIRKVDN